MTEKSNRADISPAEIADRIQKRIAEAIDRELYYPLKIEFERTSHTSRLGFLKEQLKDGVEQIIEQELSDKQVSSVIQVNKIKGIRNALYDSLPSGEIGAFELIKIIKEHIKRLDAMIDEHTQAAEIPVSVVSGRPTRYRLLLEITESITNPLVITEMFIPGSRMFINDSGMHDHDARIVDVGIMD